MGLKSLLSPSVGTVVKTSVLSFLAGLIGGVMFASSLGGVLTFIQIGLVITILGMIGMSLYRLKNRGGSSSSDADTDSDPITDFEDL